ncbi:hypothetical protein FPOA_13104 [Fusarium poae]|uniref:RNase H type-1 domain-containing protein n=1 Tax=Fusarium poae TaxID=36050 RepID=A0A1B8A6S3_FUSPO|nr:hypothetical protein FPOA_13104 [Fusarium poae]
MAGIVNLSHNYSLYSVPVAYVLALWPNIWGKLKSRGIFDRANPREFNESVKSTQSLDKITRNHILRSQFASENAHETLALFVGGILAADRAGVPVRTINLLSGGYLVSRLIFNIAYIWLQDNRKFAFLRIAAWFAGAFCWLGHERHPTTILHRESGIPPVDQLLDARRLRFSARLKSLDKAHPLASRTRPPRPHTYHDLIKRKYQIQTESSFRTRLQRTDELLAPYPRPKLVQRHLQQEEMPPLRTASKQKSAGAFSRWVESLDPLTLVVYSDGSLSPEGVASYGFTIHQNNAPIFDGSGRLGPAEVFDVEATGALDGLKAALDLRVLTTQNIFICLDNLAVATCLRGTPSGSS